MPSELSEIDHLAIRQSFGAACGVSALHLMLADRSEEERFSIKNQVISTWRAAWQEAFQQEMKSYMSALSTLSNAHKLDQPEDYQQAFNDALADAEKSARIALRMEGNT